MIDFIPGVLPGWFWVIFYIVVGFLGLRFVALNVMKPYLSYRNTRFRMKANAGGGGDNPLMNYNSFSDAAKAGEGAIIAQMDDIDERLKKRGVDPMADPAYQELQNQRDQIMKWRQRLSNPLVSTLDNTFFPVLKGVIPDIQRGIKRFLKEF